MKNIIQTKVFSRIVLSVTIAVLLTVSLLPGIVHAAVPAPSGGQAFSIAPPLLNLKVDPGKTVMARIWLTNVSSGPMVMSAQANDFAAKDESGNPNIILNTKETVPFSLKNFIQLPQPFTLAPKETRTLDVPIVVPKDGEPGGHYGVIRFTGASPDVNGTGVSLSASIGTLILLQVSGNVQERASLADLYAAVPKILTKESLFQKGPIDFITRVSNDGNTHIQPTGTLTVKNMVGKQIVSLRINGDPANSKDTPKNILPGSVRRFQVTLTNKWMFGRYNAHLDLMYDNKHLTANKAFWVIPYAIVVPVVIALVVLIFGLRFGIKKYNAHIIKKSQVQPANTTPAKDTGKDTSKH
jgi:hypothetical protein